MKKFSFIIISLIAIFSFIDVLNAEENIYIKSVEVDYSSINVIEKSKPSFDGIAVNFDLEFREVGDYVKYKVVVHNGTDEEYYVKEDTDFSNSKSFSYKYLAESSIQANSESILYLVISYDEEVDSNLIVDNKYSESNKAILELVDDKGIVIKNPKTGNGNFIIIGLSIVLIISCLVLFIINKTKVNSATFIFIFSVINFIPLFVSAASLLKLELNINVSVQTVGYYVVYNPDFDETLIDASTINQFDIINNNDTSCINIYLSDNKTIPDYIWCKEGVLLKSKKMYMPGEIAKITKINMYSLDDSLDAYLDVCLVNDSYTDALCPSFLEKTSLSLSFEHNGWVYSKYQITKAGYTFLENDLEVMNFSDIGDYNNVRFNTTFTMPEHDVYFYPNYPM